MSQIVRSWLETSFHSLKAEKTRRWTKLYGLVLYIFIVNHMTNQRGIQLPIMGVIWDTLDSLPSLQVPFQKTRGPLQILCHTTSSHKDVSDTWGGLFSKYNKLPLCYFNSFLYCSEYKWQTLNLICCSIQLNQCPWCTWVINLTAPT